jgi:hypothetical protein
MLGHVGTCHWYSTRLPLVLTHHCRRHSYRHYYDSSLRTTLEPSLRTVGSLYGIAGYGPYI